MAGWARERERERASEREREREREREKGSIGGKPFERQGGKERTSRLAGRLGRVDSSASFSIPDSVPFASITDFFGEMVFMGDILRDTVHLIKLGTNYELFLCSMSSQG